MVRARTPTTRALTLVLMGATAVAGLLGLTGCDSPAFRAPPREAVVIFKPDATAADRQQVHDDCSDLPNVTAEPMPTDSKYKSTQIYGVRFRVDKAGDRDLNNLYTCITTGHPSVQGIDLSQAGH